MDPNWNDSQPIYRQLRDRVVTMILEEVVKDGDALPSVRQVAAEYQLNPLTVLKGYQELVDEDLVEKKRGRGMFVKPGAKKALLKDERRKFMDEQWPAVVGTIRRLGLSVKELISKMDTIARQAPGTGAPSPRAAGDADKKKEAEPGGNGKQPDAPGNGEEKP